MTPTEQEPMWSDNDIIARYRVAFDRSPDVHHMGFMRWMRDDYEQQLAQAISCYKELMAAIAEEQHPAQPQAQWTPLPNQQKMPLADEGNKVDIRQGGATVVLWAWGHGVYGHLPDDIRLCQLTPVEQQGGQLATS